ncbi:hypothetical protein [Nonomuraea bangladeshensis]|uniref:hypothetical protein n=1 Tax=Nonomuraea bangladeshensis TaxID=404385 RepID=UPI003C2EEA21
MIRRFWSWLLDDDPDRFLRESAADLAESMRGLSDEQCADLFNRYPEFWWQASRVRACVDVRPGESR